MKPAIVIEQKDIVAMICEKYGVTEKEVIKSQYSYTVILPEKEDAPKDDA